MTGPRWDTMQLKITLFPHKTWSSSTSVMAGWVSSRLSSQSPPSSNGSATSGHWGSAALGGTRGRAQRPEFAYFLQWRSCAVNLVISRWITCTSMQWSCTSHLSTSSFNFCRLWLFLMCSAPRNSSILVSSSWRAAPLTHFLPWDGWWCKSRIPSILSIDLFCLSAVVGLRWRV